MTDSTCIPEQSKNYYGTAPSAEAAKQDSEVEDDSGEMDELRAKAAADDEQFEKETALASGSADKPESEKTILDKAMDKINGANDTVQENLNLAS